MNKQKKSILVPTILLAIALTFFLPALCLSGSLEPSSPPGSTMKTLDEIPPTWSQTLPANDGGPDGCNSSRFKCVFGDQAVLDMETGLVWEKAPFGEANWDNAHYMCTVQKYSSGRRGWRLPTVQELASLVDMTVEGSPKLPSGYPFTNVQLAYWSATTSAEDTNNAFYVRMDNGQVYHVVDSGKTLSKYVWCVRSGSGIDAQ